ncbi:SWIM zinc finger family protein [Spirosoma flavus]
MVHFTEEQIQSLAPDAASLKAGKGLVNPRKWPTRAVSDRVLWGEVQGSGKDPYRTQVDLTNIAFKCSCPSRKFPCKHGLGLLLLYTHEPDSFTQTPSEPTWVSEWMDKRVVKGNKLAETPNENDPETKLVKTKSQQKRASDRLESVRAGVSELARWTEDLIRTGLLGLPDKGSAFWQQTAARMVDAKAPGLATRVKQLGSLPFFDGNGWQGEALQQFGRLYLLIQAFTRLDQLPTDLQDDVKSLIGVTINQKELLELADADSVTDRFWVLARQTSVEDDLTIQRNYLYGQRSRRFAFILNFAFKNTPMQTMLAPGTAVDATVVFYPGRWPYRAVLKEQSTTQKSTGNQLPTEYANWSIAQQVLTDIVSQSPWFDEIPQIVGPLTLLTDNGRHYLRDVNGLSQPVNPNWPQESFYKWLALSGGHPVLAFVLRTKVCVLPLGIWVNDSITSYYTL